MIQIEKCRFYSSTLNHFNKLFNKNQVNSLLIIAFLMENSLVLKLQVISKMSMSSNLPFSSINPIKCIGLNQCNPFCSIVAQGKLIYTSGTNIIMENTKSNQQRILFNNTYCGQIELINHHVTLYNEHLLAVTIKDSITLMHIIVIIPLNPIIFNEEVKKDKSYTHYLKNIEEFEQIKAIEFFDEGNLFAIVSTYQNLNNLSLFRTLSGEITYQQSFIDTQLSIKSVCISKINCMSILQNSKKGQIKLCLIALDELSRKFYYSISLEHNERIIEYFNEGNQEDNIMVVLSNLGNVLIYKINQYQITLINRIDVRQPKKQQTQIKLHRREASFTDEKNHSFFMPRTIQLANNKVIIAYEETCILGILFYSHYNPKNTKFSLVEEALSNFNFVKEIKTIKMAKDNCSLAALIEIYPQKVELKTCIKQNEESPLNTEHITAFQLRGNSQQQYYTELDAVSTPISTQAYNQDGQFVRQKQYIALQIDILSNMIDHEEQAYSTEQTFTLLSGHNLVLKVEYCSYNNTMFLLMKNKMVKYYNLTPQEHQNQYQSSIPMYKQFKIKGLLLWQKLLNDQPHSMTVHPFNYTILLVYEEILKFHYFNIKNLFPAFIITSIKNCNLARYSPLGDRIVLATSGSVIILNSYTFEVMKTVSLPNILTQTQIKRISNLKPALLGLSNPKLITDLVFLKNGDMLVFSGRNSFSFILNNEKASHFGLIEQSHDKFSQMIYDSTNNLIILLKQESILVLTKSNINSKNRCEIISRIEISATSVCLIQQLGVLFVGGNDGVLHILKWPDYCQEELYTSTTNKFHQFRQPIISISVSSNYNYIYTVSKSGSFCISQLQVNQNDECLPKQITTLLLTSSQKPLRQGNRWLISRSEEQRKERQIIKLRGQEADIMNHHSQIAKKEQFQQGQLIKRKKVELESQYHKELKYYEERLGLQQSLQSITLLKDQNKLFQQKRKREIQEITSQKQEAMKLIFEERTKLEKIYKLKVEQNKSKLKKFNEEEKQQLNQLMLTLQSDKQKMYKKEKELACEHATAKFQGKCHLSNIEEDHIQEMHLLDIQHNSEVEELLNINQTILSKNRNKNIEIHDFQDKIGDLNIEKEKLQFDMYKLTDEKSRYQQLKEKMGEENDRQKRIYDKLIKASKQLEDRVLYERKEQKRYEHMIGTLQQEITYLCEKQREVSQKRLQVNDNFIEEKNLNAMKANTIIQLNKKCQQLKNTKKEKYYQNCLLKNQYSQIIKTFMRQMSIDEDQAIQDIFESYRSPTFEKKKQSVRNSEFQFLKAQHQKMANDATKWKEVKQSYMTAFFRNHKKLDQQNLKLTYRYNDLLRLSQQYKIQISNLQQNIDKLQRSNSDWKSLPKVSESRAVQSRLKPNFSFLNANKNENKQTKTKLKKKLICVSLHQESGKFITQA